MHCIIATYQSPQYTLRTCLLGVRRHVLDDARLRIQPRLLDLPQLLLAQGLERCAHSGGVELLHGLLLRPEFVLGAPRFVFEPPLLLLQNRGALLFLQFPLELPRGLFCQARRLFGFPRLFLIVGGRLRETAGALLRTRTQRLPRPARHVAAFQ